MAIAGNGGTFLAVTATTFPGNITITAVHRIGGDGQVLASSIGQNAAAATIAGDRELIAWVDSRGSDLNDVWHVEYKMAAICDDTVCGTRTMAETADVFPWMHGMAAIGEAVAVGVMRNPPATPRDREIALMIGTGSDSLLVPLAFGLDLPTLAIRHVFTDGDDFIVHWIDGRDRQDLKQFLTRVSTGGAVGDTAEIGWTESMAAGSRRLGAVVNGVQGGTMLRLLSKEGRTLLHVPFADGYDSHSGYPQIVAGGETYAIAWGQRLEPDAPPVISLQFIICSH